MSISGGPVLQQARTQGWAAGCGHVGIGTQIYRPKQELGAG